MNPLSNTSKHIPLPTRELQKQCITYYVVVVNQNAGWLSLLGIIVYFLNLAIVSLTKPAEAPLYLDIVSKFLTFFSDGNMMWWILIIYTLCWLKSFYNVNPPYRLPHITFCMRFSPKMWANPSSLTSTLSLRLILD